MPPVKLKIYCAVGRQLASHFFSPAKPAELKYRSVGSSFCFFSSILRLISRPYPHKMEEGQQLGVTAQPGPALPWKQLRNNCTKRWSTTMATAVTDLDRGECNRCCTRRRKIGSNRGRQTSGPLLLCCHPLSHLLGDCASLALVGLRRPEVSCTGASRPELPKGEAHLILEHVLLELHGVGGTAEG